MSARLDFNSAAPGRTMPQSDTSAFRDAIVAAGLTSPPGGILDDGLWHRWHGNAAKKGRAKKSFYKCKRVGDRLYGWFGDPTKFSETKEWPSDGDAPKPITAAQRAREREERQREIAARKGCEREAASEAQRALDYAGAVNGHAYLKAKGIRGDGLKEALLRSCREALNGKCGALNFAEADQCHRCGADLLPAQPTLLIPVYDHEQRELVNVQRIVKKTSEGFGKFFVKGGAIQGHFSVIGKPTDTTVIAEGYATAATIHTATGLCTVVAFYRDNFDPVAKAVRRRHPKHRIIIAADDDWKTEGNPGLTDATYAARAIGAAVIAPVFAGQRGEKDTDFNDLARLEGIDTVQRCFDAIMHENDEPGAFEPDEQSADFAGPDKGPVTDCGVTLDDFVSLMTLHRYIFKPSGDLWPASSVNQRIPWIDLTDPTGPQLGDDKSKPKRLAPAAWLDKNSPVEQVTWAPGEAQIIAGRLVNDGGWVDRPGCAVFNLYRPPVLQRGDPAKAGKWIDHARRVYPDEADHIIQWQAHRVQRPGEKINHGLVLGGDQGIGKDTILEPVKHAVGPWNFQEVSPKQLLGRFNGFVKSVILRVSEARDLGDVDRYAFYDHMKTYTAAPPDVLRCDEKNLREHAVFNVMGVIITSNHKADGIYLPADDRRHFVAWSCLTKADFTDQYWTDLYRWFANGGTGHVAAYLRTLDLTGFNPKAPPPKTAAFYDIVNANRAPEDAELTEILERLADHSSKAPPRAVTIADIVALAEPGFAQWLQDRKSSRQVPHRFEACGYVPVRNPAAKDGLWVIASKRRAVYARRELPLREQLEAAEQIARNR